MTNKIWVRKNGRAEVLSYESSGESAGDDEFQSIGVEEVVVDVHFSGVNFADIMMRLGFYKDAPPKPFVPGYEFSGVVSRVGKGVTHVQPGDKVYGGTVFGGYASRIKIGAWMVLKLPSHLSLAEGAALPVAFITAYAALVKMARVQKGDRVMIDCATGGVGTIALQMLKSIGAQTVGLTSSVEKKSIIESYGALALTHKEFQASGAQDQYDFILNSQGGKTVRAHYNRLAPAGRIVCIGLSAAINNGKRDFIALIKAAAEMPRFALISMFDLNRGVFALNALKLMEDTRYAKHNQSDFSAILNMGIKPHIGAIIPAAEVLRAHQMLESRKIGGKVLLSWQ